MIRLNIMTAHYKKIENRLTLKKFKISKIFEIHNWRKPNVMWCEIRVAWRMFD